MVPGVKARIVNCQSDFTENDNIISQYIFDNFESIPEETVTTLAKKTGTSESAIVRLCRKIGYSGFNRLKTAVTQEQCWINGNDVSLKLESNVFTEVAVSYRNMIDNLFNLVDVKELETATKLISSANNVYIISSDEFKTVALDLNNRFSTIGIKSSYLEDRTRVSNASIQTGKGDVCVFFVRNIAQSTYSNLVNVFKSNGAKLVLFTLHYSKTNKEVADSSIVVVDKMVTRNSISLSNNVLFLLVVDSLMTMLMRSDEKYVKMYKSCTAMSSELETNLNTVFYSP